MRSKFKKALAVLASAAMCGSMLLYFPDGTFDIDLTAHAAEGEVAINEENFPDPIFRTYVDDNFDTTNDDVLDADEIAMVTSIDVYGMGISDLKGVEYFTALTVLGCGSNQLTSLDVSKNTALTALGCESNQLTSLDVTNNTALTDLYCYSNQLTSLDVSNNTALTTLKCYSNQLTSLDVSKNTALTDLECSDNQLTSLDVSKNTALTELNCGSNQLTSLDVTNNTALTTLKCYFNQLTNLDVTNNTALTKLYCHFNQLISLDVSKNTALTYLDCGSNQLTSLDATNNTALIDRYCDSNTYKITLTGNTFDLSTLPEGFDVTKASEWTNATIEGNTLTVTDLTDPTQEVTYTYDLGNDSTATFTLKIASAELTKDMVQEIKAQTYTGEAITPVTLICGDYTLVEGTDYIIEYADNTNAGTASYTITGAGIFTGELTGKFEIVKAIPKYETPTNLVASDGVTLADVELPEGFAWADETKVIGKHGTYTFPATFTPKDTVNYEIVENIEITVESGVTINETNFPDKTFRNYVSENFDKADGEGNKDNFLSAEEISDAKRISVYNEGITDLKGVEYFTALTYLDCDSNQLTSLDVTNNTALTTLNCVYNQLTSLDVTNNTALTTLDCESNRLTSLDVSKNTALTDLNCVFNQLTSLDVTNNTALITLSCHSNQLTSLDVTNNTALTTLSCGSNQLTSLDVTNNTALTTLSCGSNQLTSLDVTNNTALRILYCNSNQLTSLDVSKNTALTTLSCGYNQLTSLDVTNNTALTKLYCDSNTYKINLTDNTFDLSTLPKGFDVTKASEWTNATIEGNTLTVTDPTQRVTYTYDLGNDSTATFTLEIASAELTSGIAINETNFPDPTFRTYVDDNFDTTDDNALDAAEIAMVTSIVVYDMGISNLKGVEYFTALATLDCGSNQLTSLDVTNNTALTDLDCHFNQLTSLDVTNNTALTYLNCSGNQLTSLDVTNNTALTNLNCVSNQLTSLDVSKNMALTDLKCHSNTYEITLTGNTFDLSTLPEGFDVRKASEWTNATIEGNTLTVTDLTDPTQEVTYIYDLGKGSTATFTLKIASAELTKDMVQKIEAQTYTGEKITPVTLICGKYTLVEGTDYTIEYADNTNAGTASYTITGAGIFTGELTGKFEIVKAIAINETNFPDPIFRTYVDKNFDRTDDNALDATEIAMVTRIEVPGGMGISDLKGVEYFTALTDLYCDSNQLTSLDVSKNTALTTLSCRYNQLTSLDVTNNTALTYLNCTSNHLTSLDVTNNTALTYLNCTSNHLTSLDVTNNTALTYLLYYSNTYKINLTGNTFDLSTLPEGFDVKKASEWTNATIEGNTLTVTDLTDPTQEVTYTYDLGNGSTARFTLEIASAELTEDMVQKIEAQTYTGKAITPVTLICGDYTLVEGTDYTIEYADNTNAGTASYTITGAGIFTGELTGKFEIVKAKPDYEIPTNLVASDGVTLADVKLPDGFAWADETEVIGKQGTYTFLATFTPEDTVNYEIVENIEITVESGIAINEENFPDPVFRTYVDENFDRTDDGTLDAAEIARVTSIAIYNGMGVYDRSISRH